MWIRLTLLLSETIEVQHSPDRLGEKYVAGKPPDWSLLSVVFQRRPTKSCKIILIIVEIRHHIAKKDEVSQPKDFSPIYRCPFGSFDWLGADRQQGYIALECTARRARHDKVPS